MFQFHEAFNNEIIYLIIDWVVVSNMFYFHPYLGKLSNLANIFQVGWNHQLVNKYVLPKVFFGIDLQ